ncbi:MAG TPA: rod shape-determining protein MreD [Acidimicrobiales bacterium]|nr:rod shape-determining protein MreD [Acidimicrobiales bacterium]
MRHPPPGPMGVAEVARYSLLVFSALALQHSLLDFVRISGAHPDVMLLFPAAAGYVGGPERGATVGFCTGLAVDLLLPTTFGLSALVGCLVGFGTGAATAGLVRSSWWLPVVSFTAATVTGLVGYAVLGAVLGDPAMLRADLASALVVATPAAAVLALPVRVAVAWAVPPAPPSATANPGGAFR